MNKEKYIEVVALLYNNEDLMGAYSDSSKVERANNRLKELSGEIDEKTWIKLKRLAYSWDKVLCEQVQHENKTTVKLKEELGLSDVTAEQVLEVATKYQQ